MADDLLKTLSGDYEVVVDQKERLQIPAPFRRAIAATGSERVYGYGGVNGQYWLFPEKPYNELAKKNGPAKLARTIEENEAAVACFGATKLLCLDKQGRISISQATRNDYDLNTEIVMVGVDDHIELYDKLRWKKRTDLGIHEARRIREELEAKRAAGKASGTISPPAQVGSEGAKSAGA
jgi:MraZ protein